MATDGARPIFASGAEQLETVMIHQGSQRPRRLQGAVGAGPAMIGDGPAGLRCLAEGAALGVPA
jgi:hypothetical protein